MDAFLSSAWCNPTHFQSINGDHNSSMPFSLLVEEQAFDPPFTPINSPSLDMESALQHLSSSYDSELSSSGDSELSGSPSAVDGSDVLMVDPFLDYLNEVLMEEGEEDVPWTPDNVEASYRAIVNSLYDILGDHSPPDLTSSEKISGIDISCGYRSSHNTMVDESVHASHPWDKNGHDDEIHTGLSSLTREVGNVGFSRDLPSACGDVDASLEQDKTGTSCAKQDVILEMSFEEFREKAGYADLYVGKPSLSDTSTNTGKPSSLIGTERKLSRAARKGSRSVKNTTADLVGFVDPRELLLSCAQAVAMGDVKKASEIIQELYQVHGASVRGNGLQRTAHFFCEALVARMGGMGGHLCRSMFDKTHSLTTFLKAARLWYGVTPYMKIVHYFANQNILKAAEGASRLHILDYGIFHGEQWPCLINALADREARPPLLVITGIDCPKQSLNSLERLRESGQMLAAYAATYNVPFQFDAVISDQWENIDPASLHLHEKEVLVINCMKRLRLFADESVDSASTIAPRQKLLMSMRSLNPHLLLIGEINSAGSSPFFVSRFREALYCYSNIMDMLDILQKDDLDRLYLEAKFYSYDILNIVACEGAERVVRPETYRQWDLRIKRAGFELLPIPSVILSRSRLHVKKHYRKDFLVHDDAYGWMLLGWKGRPMLAMSAWRPSLNK